MDVTLTVHGDVSNVVETGRGGEGGTGAAVAAGVKRPTNAAATATKLGKIARPRCRDAPYM
jgi:hypothetical protein